MDFYIINSIFDIFFDRLSTAANPKSLSVYYKMVGNFFLHIGIYWNFASDNTFTQNIVEYVKIR